MAGRRWQWVPVSEPYVLGIEVERYQLRLSPNLMISVFEVQAGAFAEHVADLPLAAVLALAEALTTYPGEGD